MLRRVAPIGLRPRLMVLIAWTVLGSMALLFVNALQQRRIAVVTTADEAALLSRLAAAQQERVIAVTRLMLDDWAHHEGAGSAAIASRRPGVLSSLARVTPSGRVVSSTDPREVGADVSSSEWFRRAALRRGFVVSSVYEKLGDSLSTLRCAQPVFSEDGELRAVVVATLDVARLCRAELPAHFDASTTFLLVDRRGVVMAPSGRPAARRDSSVTLAHAAEGEPWRQRVRGGDGVWRIVAFTPLRDGSSRGLYVGVSVDPAEPLARADRELATSLALLALFGMLVALVAWRGARLIVLRRVEAMQDMTRRLRAGDLGARTGLPYGSGELSELSRALDDMATALAKSQAERESWQKALEALSVTDELTGLHNRRGFLAFAAERMRMLARDGGDAVVVSLDLDDFKAINDTHGHAAGDDALRELARVLRACFRTTDVIGRIGGDEFVVLAAVKGAHGTRRALTRLHRALGERNASGRLPFALAASVGWALARPGAAEDLDTLLARADRSMYRRKRQRRGTLVVPPASPAPARERRRPSRVA